MVPTLMNYCVVGVGVSISAFQAGVPGSSPGRRIFGGALV